MTQVDLVVWKLDGLDSSKLHLLAMMTLQQYICALNVYKKLNIQISKYCSVLDLKCCLRITTF